MIKRLINSFLVFQLINSFSIKEHIRKCSLCKTQPNNMKQFEIIRKCQTSYEAKIHEALVIKRSNPVLNKQLYVNGASFLPNVF